MFKGSIAMPSIFPRSATGCLALMIIAAGVSGCSTALGAYGPWEPRGTALGQDRVTTYQIWVKDLEFRGSLDSLGADAPLIYGVSLGGTIVECASQDCSEEIRAYENGETPGTAAPGHEEGDDGSGSPRTSPGL